MEKVFRHKIFSDWNQACKKVDRWKSLGHEVVFTNGCFDLIHLGHIHYLEEASRIGDKLVIGLNSDKSVSRLKGKNRPINDEQSRAALLAVMYYVDMVIIFSEDTPLALIEKITPDVLVKGGDYKIKDIIGYQHVKEMGGEVKTIPFLQGYSSTSIIQKIKSQK